MEVTDYLKQIIDLLKSIDSKLSKSVILKPTVDSSKIVTDQLKPKIVPLSSSTKPAQQKSGIKRINNARIIIDNKQLNSATGTLPVIPVVNKKSIIISDEHGTIIGASKGLDGQISGDHVSGLISGNGKYRLVFSDYPSSCAFVSYDTREEIKGQNRG